MNMGWVCFSRCVESRKPKDESNPCVCPGTVVAISNCQLSMNLQKHKQTAEKGAPIVLQLKRLGVSFFSQTLLTLTQSASGRNPSPVNMSFFSEHGWGLLLFLFLFVCRIMQIKWHISMSVAVLLLQFSTFYSLSECNQRFLSGLPRGWAGLGCLFNSRKSNTKKVIILAKRIWAWLTETLYF